MTQQWQDYYKERLVTHAEAAKHVQSNWLMMLDCASTSTSAQMHQAIFDRANELENVIMGESLVMAPHIGLTPQGNEKLWGHIQFATGYALGPARELYKQQYLDKLVCQAHDTHVYLANNCDAIFASVSPPDEHGFLCKSVCNFYTLAAIREGKKTGKNKLVVAEVNDQLPVVYGDNFIHVSEIDYFVEISSPLPEFSSASPNPSKEELAIAQFVSEMINDGDTIQIGIGTIPETVVSMLDNKHDLGVHSELLSNGFIDLIEKGVITNTKKTELPGITSFAFALGDKRLYDYATRNYKAQCLPGAELNDPRVIARQKNIFAVNNILLVDLTGQSTCEGLGTRQVSGIGGQLNFQIGSSFSEGGRALQLVLSTKKAKDGTLQSAIVPTLPEGTPVSTPRYFADYIVTEYGVADLRYRTQRQRLDALIAIAHPDFRGELRQAARKRFYPAIAQN